MALLHPLHSAKLRGIHIACTLPPAVARLAQHAGPAHAAGGLLATSSPPRAAACSRLDPTLAAAFMGAVYATVEQQQVRCGVCAEHAAAHVHAHAHTRLLGRVSPRSAQLHARRGVYDTGSW
jgi:hypothetical protein